jgi:hypothetical protein
MGKTTFLEQRRPERAKPAAQAASGGLTGPVANGLAARREQIATSPRMAELEASAQLARGADRTGLPGQLKAGMESLSGMSMDHVKVHYNSSRPAQLQAHAYAQGSDIHLAPGQERHLPHEAWHVVQQAQGRVAPTGHLAGTALNDNAGLEREADVMGARASGAAPAAQLRAMPSGGAVVQRVIKGLGKYTDPAQIPDTWVHAFIDDLADPQAHLSQSDIVQLYHALTGANPPKKVTLVHAGADHWDLSVKDKGKDAYQVTTRHDGSCGIHVVDAMIKIVSTQITGPQANHAASDEFVGNARQALKQHYQADESPEEVRKIIAGVIRDKETLPDTGFGRNLRALIEGTGMIDNRDQEAALAAIRHEGKSEKSGGPRSPSPKASSTGGKAPDHKDERAAKGSVASPTPSQVEVMRAYLGELKGKLKPMLLKGDMALLGAKLAYGFFLIGDKGTAFDVLREFGHASWPKMPSVEVNDPKLHLAVVLTEILEHVFNELHDAVPFVSAHQVAMRYASEIANAFSLKSTAGERPNALGPGVEQVPPKTISGVLGKGDKSDKKIFLGHNANQHARALAHRRTVVKGTGTASSLDTVNAHVIGGSMTEDRRDPLNCAECIPITTARKAGLSVGTDDVYPLSLHDASSYSHIKTCENCQTMYGIQDRSERKKEQEREKKKENAAALTAYRSQVSERDKARATTAKAELKGEHSTFEADVTTIYSSLKKSIKGVGRDDIKVELPIARYAPQWAAMAQDARVRLVREAMEKVSKQKGAKKTAKK